MLRLISRFSYKLFSWLFIFSQIFNFFVATAFDFQSFWYFHRFSKSKSCFVAFYSIFPNSFFGVDGVDGTLLFLGPLEQ